MFAFRVLARPYAFVLTAANTVMCSMLLFPAREGLLAMGIFAGLFAAALAFDRWLSKGNPVLRTGEGRVARLIMLIPVAIVGVRASFYVSDITAFAVLFGLGSIAGMLTSAQYLKRGVLRELAIFVCSGIAALAWLVWNLEFLRGDSLVQVLTLAPMLSLFFLIVGKLSEQGVIYRYISGVFTMLVAMQLTVWSVTLIEPTIALAFGIGLCMIGYSQEWRAPFVTGAITMVAGAVAILFHALASIEVGTWVGLAVGGVALVIVGSLVDRYGSTVRQRTQESWEALSTWS